MTKTKQAKRQEQTETEVREDAIKSAHVSLRDAKTAADVREVWKDHYLLIGHRILGRLLLGQDVESATRRRSSKE